MKLAKALGPTALLMSVSASAFADPVDNPGSATFTIEANSQIRLCQTLTFGGTMPSSTLSGNVDGQGNITITQSDIVLQPINGQFFGEDVTITPVPTRDFSGNLNAATGNASLTAFIRFDLSGAGGVIPAGCYIPEVQFQLNTQVTSGASYDQTSGLWSGADVTFTVDRSQGCGFIIGPVIDSMCGLPSMPGSSQALFNFSTNPILTGS